VYEIEQPDDLDRLLDEIADDPEQNLPYWAEIWPSGVALADAIALHPAAVRGLRALEIGSGIGITAIAALRAGADLTVTDYAPPALDLCRRNTLANAGREPQTLQFNWRNPSDEFLALGPFPVVLAADVLYESRDVEPLLTLLEQIVAPSGLLWLAEPGRAVARRFVELARDRGWTGPQEDHHGPWPDPNDAGITVSVYRLRREPS
jgi:predicted nicotinamide N-methyase